MEGPVSLTFPPHPAWVRTARETKTGTTSMPAADCCSSLMAWAAIVAGWKQPTS